MKKSVIATLILSLAASYALAGGAVGTIPNTSTNDFTYTHTGTSPITIERIDIRCSTVNTATVTVVNYTGITNTLVTSESTNGIVEYAPATANIRVDKDGVLTVDFTSAITTNIIAIYPVIQ